MSGISGTGVSTGSSTTSSVAAPTGTLGNAAPVSFPGVASGIDYNSIIEKYTAVTQSQEVPYQTQLNNLTTANTEILKIQSLLGNVQSALKALSQPSTFTSFSATLSNTAAGTATSVAGQTALAGTYQILHQTAATATQIVSASGAGVAWTAADTTTPLANLGAAITPTNGTAANGTPAASGSFTINGVQISYNVATDSLQTIVGAINAANAGVTATLNADGTVTFTATTAAGLALGSASDSGNVLSVLHLDNAQITGTGIGQSVTSSAPIVGLNQYATLQGTGNAGFATPVTSGAFTINGVSFTLDASTQSVNDIINEINASTAGVVATFNPTSGSISLTSTTPGPRNIVVGSASDSSNFLIAAGLEASATTGLTPIQTTGTQASLTYVTPTGTTATVYSQTDAFTGVIPGFSLSIATSTSTPYSVTVANDPSNAESAISSFVTAYNAAMNEINTASAPPTISQTTSNGTTSASQTSSGGPLYNNLQVTLLRNNLVQLVSSFIPSGSNAYNSLASIGLSLNTSTTTSGVKNATNSTSTTSGSNGTSTFTATDGTLSALDTATFEAALAADPSAVSAIFTSATSGLAYTLGAQLTNTTGLPTMLANGIAGTIPSQSLLTSLQNANQQQIDSLNQQISFIQQQADAQANQLRAEFTASEAQIAELQALQSQIAAIGR